MHLSRERDAIRSEALSEIEKLQRMADSLQSDVERGRVEKDRTQHEFFECRDALLQKEFQVKELRDDYTRKVDSMQKLHYEEMRKLQHIIDDQSELIHSYERYTPCCHVGWWTVRRMKLEGDWGRVTPNTKTK